MKYSDGKEVKLGDRVGLGNYCNGFVVCSIDADEYSEEHPKEQWVYLKKRVMIEFPSLGLIHYELAEEDLQLISRAE